MRQKRLVYLRCPWCQRERVEVKRGRLASHLSPGGVKCIGIGMDVRHRLDVVLR